jgi:acetyl-CoA carboxylase biotin carboxylase subunit
MAEAGLPILPSGTGTLDTVTEAKRVAERVDYPLILKAAAGGGGRGMAVVREPGELARTYEQTRAHAQAVFGDSRVYAERYVEAARHVEVQVLCDRHGHAVHLGERDCSVQRRHQKLVEESPAPNLPPDLLDAICRAAVRGAGAVGYVGAGTFEFLVDTDNRFYFMEVNSRLQVEHGVTEMVTGIDLVREQIEVAAGRPLPFGQQDVLRRGVAVECRVNSEDPAHDFAPTPGTLTEFRPPSGPFTRVDTHAFPGWRIPPGYDSLLAKVIVWAPTRPQALVRMRRALQEFHIAGPQVRTTAAFLRKTMAHPWFREAKHTTSFVDQVLAGQADADDA